MKKNIPILRLILTGAGALGAGFFFVSCLACQGGAVAEATGGNLLVAAWNVEALFDGRDSGTEYEDYRAAAGWTEAKYRARLENVGKAVRAIADGGPDLLALEEIENAGVLRDLGSGPLRAMGYQWMATASIENSALTMGLLSRWPLGKPRLHAVSLDGEAPPRPILEIEVEIPGAPLTLFLCHWKSKLGGADETEPQRRASASVLSRRIAELSAAVPGRDFLILGDLNENHDEFERRGLATLTALLPDSDAAALVAGGAVLPDSAAPGSQPKDFLILTSTRPPASGCFPAATALYSPWVGGAGPGSYAYQGAWETIDHALAGASLFDGTGWDWAGFSVAAVAPMTGSDGLPVAYNPRLGTGFSDHLPIVVELRRPAPEN